MRKLITVVVIGLVLCAAGSLAAQQAPPETKPAAPDSATPAATPAVTGATNGNGEHAASECGQCHTSSNPTHDAFELKPCTRPPSTANVHPSTEAPDVLYMDELSEIYVPVVFPHKLHAEMTGMSGGCEVCHHRNPPGRILRCGECHGGPSNPVDLRQPGLKGAYHRQCLGCHREWTHETDCAVCHVKKVPGAVPPAPPSSDDIMGTLHPNIEVPDVKVYRVEDMPDTPVVTFHHKQHEEAYAIKCVQCHREEGCSHCHDVRQAPQPRVREDPHEDCTACHEKETSDDCAYCHKAEETKGFDHEAVTGHALAPYHASVSCRRCHPGEARIAKAETKCEACHSVDWAPEEFDHALTGHPLDETHSALSCPDCHLEGMAKPVSCKSCHDDERKSFPKPKPAEPEAPAPTS